MPTYEYVCTSCGYEFELMQGITAEPEKRCPKCGCLVERKIGGGAGILFKGSGFYATDYRSRDYQAKAKAEQSGGETAAAKSGDAGAKAGADRAKGGASNETNKSSEKRDASKSGESSSGGTKPAASNS